MNRRDFFKAALGVAGVGALGGVIAEQPDISTRIYPLTSGMGDTVLRLPEPNWSIPDHTHHIDTRHTHELPPYLTEYTIFDLEELG